MPKTQWVIEFSHGGWHDGIGMVTDVPSMAYRYDDEAEARKDLEWLNTAAFHRNMFSLKVWKPKGAKLEEVPNAEAEA